MMAMSQRTRERRIAEQRAGVMPLSEFPQDKQDEIAYLVSLDEPPAPQIALGGGDDPFPIAWIPSRAWHEWHWARGIDPDERRSGVSKRLRRLVIERDGYTCGICGGDVDPGDVHIDHIHPVSRGGRDDLSNLRVTHSRCNLSKGARI